MKFRSFVPKYIFLSMIIILNIFLGIKLIAKNNYTNNFFRIHVVANSDSPKDQIVKYKICEALDSYFSNSTKYLTLNSSKEALNQIQNDIENISTTVQDVLDNNEIDYSFYIKLGNIYYDEKTKNNESMPSGTYPSIQIMLGESMGQNWWSIIYPRSVITKTENGESSTLNDSPSDKIIFRSGFINLIKKLFD